MKLALKRFLITLYRFVFARRQWYALNRFLHTVSLRGMGVLNYENSHVSGETHFLKSYLGVRAGSVVFDVGANVGSYAEAVLNIQASARVFAFEPHPITFERLHDSARRFGFTAVNAACGEKPGELTLYDYSGQDGSQHASLHREVFEVASLSEHRIKVIVLDDFTAQRGIERVDLLKLDVEGHELNVLKGFQKFVNEGRVDAIQFEFNAMNVSSRVFFKDFYECLNGYSFYRMVPNGLVPLPVYDPTVCEIFAFQNIVALRRGAERDGT